MSFQSKLVLVPSIILIISLVCCRGFVPGGGGLIQEASSTVAAGDFAVVKLELLVPGLNRSAVGRYQAVQLLYKYKDVVGYLALRPETIIEKSGRETYLFKIPTSAEKDSREIEYYITLKMDGVENKIDGTHSILVTRN